jgi:glutathione S-transferase
VITLVMGNKNYSSWSIRPWLALKHAGIPFEEIVIPLDRPETTAAIAKHSPSGRVPCLLDGDITVWDSLAICEYAAEHHPALWPADRAARAKARSVAAEMHSGFAALRTAYPMNIRASKPKAPTPEVAADIKRIRAVWRDCLTTGGPFLFGAFSIADCMYAPVVTRFRTYGVTLDGPEAAYADAVWEHPAMVELRGAAAEEPWTAGYDKA